MRAVTVSAQIVCRLRRRLPSGGSQLTAERICLVDVPVQFRRSLEVWAQAEQLDLICVDDALERRAAANRPTLWVIGPDGDGLASLVHRFNQAAATQRGDADRSGSSQTMAELCGESPAMRTLRDQIASVAPIESTVLLSGETGTGKGLVARLLHAHSRRSHGPFVHVDCASLSPTLIESELFGHERGAFTGATARRVGRFELAARGTLFLDEIGDLAHGLQSKLLRVLQDREFERIGGTRSLRMSARVIAASNRDLPRAVSAGRFRADLYYRLNVVHLHVPALRERPGDVPLLVQSGLARVAEKLGVRCPVISEAVLARLGRHPWHGNVRELLNVLERLAVRSEAGPVDAAAVEKLLGGSDGALAVGPQARRIVTRDRIRAALRTTRGNVAQAARLLGLPRSTLRYRLGQLETDARDD